MKTKITVEASINANTQKAWEYYTNPKHIVNWNFAHPSWHCPLASNDMQVGGMYKARMEAKDGSFGFDFEACYSSINIGKEFTYEFGGRSANIKFIPKENQTVVSIVFDAEDENTVEMQQSGWQAILDNFKLYVESN
jgi:uncharacterized protein YndB with AHSA1/START domain